MSHAIKATGGLAFPGAKFQGERTIAVDGKSEFSFDLAAALAGALTTRGSNTAGTLTVASGHGVTDAARGDIYWTNADGTEGTRRGVLVGTVTSTTIPFSGGAGDNLPVINTGGSVTGSTIRFQVPTQQDFTVVGNNVRAIACKSNSPDRSQVVFADGSADVHNVLLDGENAYLWDVDNGVTNPLAGDTPTKFFMSHNGLSAKKVYVALGFN